jgi:Zn ribbon nucleic-acid-binding protein
MRDHSIRVGLPTDERGRTGQRCPKCRQYFKLKFGTGLPIEDRRCPHCCHLGDGSDFLTPEQLEYAKSVALNELNRNVLGPMLRNWGQRLERSTRGSLIQVRIRYNPRPVPISYYRERQLETDVTCRNCRLEFAVYGVFATCPDCGQPNALDVFRSSIEVSRKLLEVDTGPDRAMRAKLLASILSDGVSTFDALGKALRAHYPSALPSHPKNLFQNLVKLEEVLESATKSSLTTWLSVEDHTFLLRLFQPESTDRDLI